MNIMYATDENYVEIAGISIESLLDHNRNVHELILYIVEDNISRSSRKKLELTAQKYHREVVFLPKPNIRELTGTDLLTLRWSDSAFSRLYLDLVFENDPNITKILYLDCDTMILDSLETLWNYDVEDCLGAAVMECMGNWHKKIVGAKPSDPYFNSGVMLMNVERWKNEGVGQKCTEFIRTHKGRIEYVDQGVINGVLANELRVVDSPRYNLTTLSWDFSYQEMQVFRKPDHGYTEEQWEAAKRKPAIIHFTTSFLSIRPWFEGSNTPWTETWREYKYGSEWKDAPLRVMQNRESHDRKVKVFHALPRRMAVAIAGALHAYVKPVAFVVNGGLSKK